MRYEIWRIFTLQHNDPHCRSEERSDILGAVAACGLRILSAELGTPGIRYELRDMRYEICRIFTLTGNAPPLSFRGAQRRGNPPPCCKGTDCHALRARNDRGYRYAHATTRNISYLVSRISYLVSRISYLISRISYLISYISYLISHILYLISHISYLVSATKSPIPFPEWAILSHYLT